MCGIVGAVSFRDIASILLEGLKRLEYRGYDSAGMVTIDAQQHFCRHRVSGKVIELEKLLQAEPLPGFIGIAHTRWATHGKPNESNAHPHIARDNIALVHNGIVENHEKIRDELLAAGFMLTSETDSELVAHLVDRYIISEGNFLQAVFKTTEELEGAYAIGFIHRTEPNHLIALRRGSPLVIGLGKEENFIASDPMALLSVANQFIYLEDGDVADIYRDRVIIYDSSRKPTERVIHPAHFSQDMISKGQFRHFMLKEIFEQPQAVASTLEGRFSRDRIFPAAFGVNAENILPTIQRVQIVACGTSYHAGLVGKYWLEAIAKIPTQVEIASEFRYRPQVVEPNTLFVTLSQSGETADTLAALHASKALGYTASLSICNVPSSSMVRESDLVLLTNAGPEIGVASTKAFTTQLTALLMLTLVLSKYNGVDHDLIKSLIKWLRLLPKYCEAALALDPAIKVCAYDFAQKTDALFLGRGIQYPIALEGALKLKEISYIHAEAYAAGELKHGPIALIDDRIPVVVLAPTTDLIEKLKSNLQEVLARGGNLLVFSDKNSGIRAEKHIQVIEMPCIEAYLTPIIYAIPMQLLAYHVAVVKGTDVDQPRNLAKSVTVE